VTAWSGSATAGPGEVLPIRDRVGFLLLWQLEDYLKRGGTDRALQLTRNRTSYLTSSERREVLETFFDAHWHNQIFPHARYKELFIQRQDRRPFSEQDVRDLQMWFKLAWFAKEFREEDRELVTA
jgi:alpha-amylase/alpha-mannosidase (GH57 family)